MQVKWNLVSVWFSPKKTSVVKEGNWPVYMRITSNGKYAKVSTQRKCHPDDWIGKFGRMKGKKEAAPPSIFI